MRYFLFLLTLSLLSCNNQRVLQLPEIEKTKITEVLDVSPGYIFYDETQPDSTLLNRKNLISTTNWLINVDKRLSLKQAVPHIKFLQDKKRNAELHKNEDAKNYFTCNDTGIGNLGFIEFTNVFFNTIKSEENSIATHATKQHTSGYLVINNNTLVNFETNAKKRIKDLKQTLLFSEKPKTTILVLTLYFDDALSFQDYITVKSKLQYLINNNITIDANEFIY